MGRRRRVPSPTSGRTSRTMRSKPPRPAGAGLPKARNRAQHQPGLRGEGSSPAPAASHAGPEIFQRRVAPPTDPRRFQVGCVLRSRRMPRLLRRHGAPLARDEGGAPRIESPCGLLLITCRDRRLHAAGGPDRCVVGRGPPGRRGRPPFILPVASEVGHRHVQRPLPELVGQDSLTSGSAACRSCAAAGENRPVGRPVSFL